MAHSRWTIALWLLLTTVSVGLMLAAASAARAAPDQPAWVLVEGSGAAVRLYAPTSGALLAQTPAGLIRSDDGGTTWQSLQLPAGRRPLIVGYGNVAVDPTDHNVVFASVSENNVPDTVARSTDGGASWIVLTLPPDTGREIANISVSPADPSLVFVSRRLYGMLWQFMSRDRGDTWELRSASGPGMTCGWGVVAFLPHPTDPEQVYRRAGCHRTNTEAEVGPAPLEHSVDRGASWVGRPGLAAVRQIVGGKGAAPTRFYVVSNVVPSRNPTASTARVFRSENGVDGWTQLASIPDARGEGLAYNPALPDQVYAGLKDGRVLASADGGQSWTQLGQPIASIYDLALGIDGRNLYAATVDGVWRLPLQPGPDE